MICEHDWGLGTVRKLPGNPFAKECLRCKEIIILESPYDQPEKLKEIKVIKHRYYLSLGILIGSFITIESWIFFNYLMGV